MKLTVISFLLFSSFLAHAMDTNLFFKQNKYVLDNPTDLDLLDYFQKINTAISQNLDWQNFLANAHQTQKAIKHITRFSGCIRHDIVAAIILLDAPENHVWTKAYIQKNPQFTLDKVSNIFIDTNLEKISKMENVPTQLTEQRIGNYCIIHMKMIKVQALLDPFYNFYKELPAFKTSNAVQLPPI